MKYLTLVILGVFLWSLLSEPETREPDPPDPLPLAAIQMDTSDSWLAPAVAHNEDAQPVAVDKPEEKPSSGKKVLARVSAYCPCARCCGRMDGITAANTSAWKPGIAADWYWLPRGTKIYVPGYGTYTVDDKGGAMKVRNWRCGTPRLDIRFKYHWKARNWGVRYITVTVLP